MFHNLFTLNMLNCIIFMNWKLLHKIFCSFSKPVDFPFFHRSDICWTIYFTNFIMIFLPKIWWNYWILLDNFIVIYYAWKYVSLLSLHLPPAGEVIIKYMNRLRNSWYVFFHDLNRFDINISCVNLSSRSVYLN